MIYLTYNDQPSGVFSSQVNDVCNFLNTNLDAGIRLVAIISIRGFMKNREKIKSEVKGATVLPALPTAKYWQFSSLIFALYCLVTGERKVISRNVIATMIALKAKKAGLVTKICFDGRGAIAAEWKEYDVVAYPEMVKSIGDWEKKTVLESDYHISVSEKLAEWWNEAYGYNKDQHVIIPCTLHTSFKLTVPDEGQIKSTRINEGYHEDDIIMVYSGSNSGWQSFNKLESILGKILSQDKKYKLLFLSKPDESIAIMKSKYPGQVTDRWITFDKVQSILSMCDYGILYREQSITNKVAAPTKFAEYLSAGLPVMISEGIGDYTDFVRKHNCGIILNDHVTETPLKNSNINRSEMIRLVKSYYTKTACTSQYKKLLSAMN